MPKFGSELVKRPNGVINVLPGRGEITGQCIAEHPGVRYVSFTGSPGVGQHILRTCDRHVTARA